MRALLSAPAVVATSAGRALPSWVAPLLLFVAIALVYAINLDRPPHPDELCQIIPAEGLLADRRPRIADGLYTRAMAQTWIIAASLRLFGDSLAAARLSSVLGIAGATALLFLWLRRGAGPTAAWLGALGFGLSPFAVGVAQFARIYGLQTFAFSVVCLLTYAALTPSGPGPRPAMPASARPCPSSGPVPIRPRTTRRVGAAAARRRGGGPP